MEDIIKLIEEKYRSQNQDPKTYLSGLYHAKPINYWEYIEVETLLSLQKPKTNFPDEFIFIAYHQVIELVLKMMIHELKQLTADEDLDAATIAVKIQRACRYTDMLASSFTIMNQGMDYEQYNQFRLSLAPASGFQSAQFRTVEIYATDLDNLINERGKALMPEGCALEDKFDYLYWQDAGYNRQTGVKSPLLALFEEKYKDEFVRLAQKMESNNLRRKIIRWREQGFITEELNEALRLFDHKFNVEWPMVHLQTAHTYLGSGSGEKAATGGSQWEKYLHPKYQRRIFFPELWNEEELANWGC